MRSSVTKALKVVLIRDVLSSNDSSGVRFPIGVDDEPIPILTGHERALYGRHCWSYRGQIFRVDGSEGLADEEIKLRIKHEAVKRDKQIRQIRREIEAFDNFTRLVPFGRRERIPESVRMFVWQRDEGRCVDCGNKEGLEFDHIIPVVEGGSTTERNLQLLCEACNRRKGRRI